jgi:hypothetical protein
VRNNGESNPATYIIGALLLAGGFYVYHVAPVYWGNLEAKEAAAEAWNVYIQKGEETAVTGVLVRLNGKNPDVMHLEVDEEGVESWKPGYGLAPEQVTIKLDEATRKLTVRIEYDRYVDFKPLKKRKKFHLIAEKTGTISK